MVVHRLNQASEVFHLSWGPIPAVLLFEIPGLAS